MLVNISLPDDTDDLTQQSELFEQVCSERISMRQKNSSGGAEPDDNEDDETWLQRGRRRSSENESTVRPESNSDDENTEDANDSMDVDTVDRNFLQLFSHFKLIY